MCVQVEEEPEEEPAEEEQEEDADEEELNADDEGAEEKVCFLLFICSYVQPTICADCRIFYFKYQV